MAVAKLKADKVKLKKPEHLKNNVFEIYSPKIIVIETANTASVDTELILKLPSGAKAFLTSKFKGKKIHELTGNKSLWITVRNESYFDKLTIKKCERLGYLVVQPEGLKIQYEAKKVSRKNIYLQTGKKRGKATGKRRWKQKGGFLNRYDFAYAGRDVVN